jgi:hypothetical protein
MPEITGEELYRQNRNGKSFDQLAKENGMTRGAVAGKVKRYQEAPPPPQEQIREEGGTNDKTVEHVGRITSLDEMLKVCKVDLDVWAVDHWVCNKWEVGRKGTVEDLAWSDGVLTGTKTDNGQINVEPLFQVKVWLVRKKPVVVKPIIRPIETKITYQKTARASGGLYCAVLLPDPQFGFLRNPRNDALTPMHDRAALSVALQLVEIVKPDVTVWLGDVMDFSSWSDKFVRRPEFYFTTQPALCEASWTIAQTRFFTRGDVSVIEGNHDKRPETAMVNHLVDAYELRSADQLDKSAVMSIDNLLGLSRMGVNYVGGYPDGEVWLNSSARCVHGNTVKSGAANTARAIVENETTSVFFGHIHRAEMATRTVWRRGQNEVITAFSPGCLCRIDGAVPGSSAQAQWQQGAAVVWYGENTMSVVPVPIHDGRAIYNGAVITAQDYTARMERETGYDWKEIAR